jgi:hypothetical protein
MESPVSYELDPLLLLQMTTWSDSSVSYLVFHISDDELCCGAAQHLQIVLVETTSSP